MRIFWAINGIFLPAIALLLLHLSNQGLGSNLGAKLWQSGGIQVYADLLLDRNIVAYFTPLLALSMVGLSAYCRSPNQSSDWIGLMLITGFVLYIQYMMLLIVAVDNFIVYGPLNAAIVGLLLRQIIGACASVRRFSIGRLFLLMTLVAIPIGALANFLGQDLSDHNSRLSVLPLSILSGALISAPLLALWAFASAISCFFQTRPPKALLANLNRFHWSAVLVWLMGYVATWKFSIESAIQLYSQLPKSKPNCYVSTAAATGHTWLVQSQVNEHGHVVNWQMRYLKTFELIMATKFPRTHHWFRQLYNCLGPVAARRVENRRWLADLTYMALIPLGLTSRALLRLLRVDRNVIAKLYA